MIGKEMEQNKIKKKEVLYMGILYVALLAFKLIFVIGNRSFPIISDEFNYEFMSWQLTERGIYDSGDDDRAFHRCPAFPADPSQYPAERSDHREKRV